MGQIKSALEIALERTADIKSDANAGEKRKLANIGKKIASDFLQSGDKNAFKKAINDFKREEKDCVTKSAVLLLATRIQLPNEETDLEILEKLNEAFEILFPHKGFEQLFATVAQVFSQYLLSQKQLEQALEQQFAPKLRQKEEELAKLTGQNIQLSPKQDPDFCTHLERNLSNLKEQYDGAVQEIKARIKQIAQIEEFAE